MWRAERLLFSLHTTYRSTKKRNIPFFVINLDSRTDRLQRVQEQAKQQDVQFVRMKALTSNDVDDNIITRQWQATLNSKFDRKQDPDALVTLSNGERGCAGSHAQIWERIRHETTPVCIMEDDVMLRENFKHIFNMAMEWVEKNSITAPILYLEHLVAEWKGKGVDLTTTHFMRPITYGWNLGCYVVWPSTVKLLLQNLPMKEPVDNYIAKLMYEGKVNAFGVDPAIARQFCNHCDGDIEHTYAPVGEGGGGEVR